jgi:hypothetical protein
MALLKWSKWFYHVEGVYVIKPAGFSGPCKIGRSTNVPGRLATLQAGSPQKLEVYAVYVGGVGVEAKAHAMLAEKRAHGEWFDVTPDEAVRSVVAAGGGIRIELPCVP